MWTFNKEQLKAIVGTMGEPCEKSNRVHVWHIDGNVIRCMNCVSSIGGNLTNFAEEGTFKYNVLKALETAPYVVDSPSLVPGQYRRIPDK